MSYRKCLRAFRGERPEQGFIPKESVWVYMSPDDLLRCTVAKSGPNQKAKAKAPLFTLSYQLNNYETRQRKKHEEDTFS